MAREIIRDGEHPGFTAALAAKLKATGSSLGDDWHTSRQTVYRFDNGLGASVILLPNSIKLDQNKDKFEIAVLKFDGDDWGITYKTPITSDVIQGLNQVEVEEVLDAIESLEVDHSWFA